MRVSPLVLSLLLAGCATAGGNPPATFVHSTAESRNTVVIDVREGLSRAAAMRTLTDALAANYTVEVTDPRAGFVMTAWAASTAREGVPELRYRTRFVAQFTGDDWRKLQLRQEANWARGQEWEVGFDAAQLDAMSTELRARLGRRP
ncbi:MAG: hypothetical protein JWN79_326 [Gemmatimonadetes bacterium]|jgi:hypothetical protein|nr:hypothetical protein [Gemmatimonadota bacterium]